MPTIEEILGRGGPSLGREVARLQQTAEAVGAPTELTEPRESLFARALNFIGKPQQALLGPVDALLRGDLGAPSVGFGIERGLKERVDPFEMLRRHTDLGPVARTAIGLPLAIGTDPLNLISFAPKAALIGGRAVTALGAERKLDALKTATKMADEAATAAGRALDPTQLAIEADKRVAKAYDSLSQYDKIAEKVARAVSKTDDPAAKNLITEAYGQKMADLQAGFDGILSPAEAKDLFEPSALHLGMNVPFLGHFTGKEATRLADTLEAPSTNMVRDMFRQGFAATSDVLNFDKVSKAVRLPKPVTDTLSDGLDIIRSGLDNITRKLETTSELAPDVPILGGLAQKGAKGALAVADTVKAAGKALRKTFAMHSVFGPAGNDYKDFVNARAAIGKRAEDLRFELFPEALQGEAGQKLLQNTGVEYDSLAVGALREAEQEIRNLPGSGQVQKDMLDSVNKMLRGEGLDESELQRISPFLDAAQEKFNNRLGAYLKGATPEQRDIVTRLRGAFDDIRKAEMDAGLDTKEIAFYLPHLYRNLNKPKGIFSNRKNLPNNFTKRKFDTLKDAFEAEGLIGATDPSELFQTRWAKSQEAIKAMEFGRQVVMKNALDVNTVRKLVLQATDPAASPEIQKAARMLLDSENIPLPKIIPKAQPGELGGEEILEASERAQRRAGIPTESRPSAYDEIVTDPDIQALPDDIAKRTVLEEVAGSNDAFRNLLRLRGFQPFTEAMPIGLKGQTARLMTEKFGEATRKFYLPEPIAQALDDVKLRRDHLKDFSRSIGAEGLLDLHDRSVNWIKGLTTGPWPSYWFNNAFGSQLLSMTKNLAAAGAGATSDVWHVTHANGAIRTRAGQTLSNKFVRDSAKEFGIYTSPKELQELTEAAKKTDIAEYIGRNKGVMANLAAGEKMNAIRSAQRVLTDKTENFFRMRQYVHYLKEGSAAPDAARAALDDLVNYRTLSPIEQSVFRRFIFFYGWMKGSTAHTLSNMFTNPGAIANQMHVARGVSELFSGKNPPSTLEEEEAKMADSLLSSEQFVLPLGRGKSGKALTAQFGNLPLNTLLQNFSLHVPRNFTVSEIVDSISDDADRNLQKIAAASNPWLRTAIERMAGKSMYFDRPLDSEFLRKVPSLAAIAEKMAPFPSWKVPGEILDDVVMRKFLKAEPDGKGNFTVPPGMFMMATHFFPPLSRMIATGKAMANPDTPLGQSALRMLTTIRVDQRDPEASSLYKKKEELQKLLQQPMFKTRAESLREEKKRQKELAALSR
jgi:predicted NAD-dependent protein-ADP-ribosyltransferase YbiA (DUF1768 family)